MHSHTGCICLTYLHYVFLNKSSNQPVNAFSQKLHFLLSSIVCFYVFWNCLLEKRQSHTDCNCLIFLHCVCSNASSNSPFEKMHSHTSCICLTFLQYVFQNVSSNRLPERMQSHIDCTSLNLGQSVSLSRELSFWHNFQPSPNFQDFDQSQHVMGAWP